MTQGVDTSGTPGALVQPTYMFRTSRVYAVNENELDQIGTLDVISTFLFSVSGSCASFALSLGVSEKMNPTSTPDGKAIVALGVPAGWGAAVVCLVLGLWAWCKKGGTLKAIRSESRAVPPDGLSVAAE